MALTVVAFFGGVLTILSPCILPVLPFVFARAGQPFVRSGLPLLAGMALTFVAVATLAAVGGGLAVAANTWGRAAALVLLGLFGSALLFPALADRLTRPLVALGARLAERPDSSAVSSLVLGVATGMLWAPCAGPILGLVLTGAAIQGPNTGTALLLLAYALGAASSLSAALLAGTRVLRMMRGSLGTSEHLRRGFGAVVLVSVVAIALGLDTGFLTRVSTASTTSLEQALIDRVRPTGAAPAPAYDTVLTALSNSGTWLNTPPLTATALRGKVVLIDFWTYSCINCLRTLPYVRAWYDKYKDHGLVVIGVHTPEFAFERDLANVRRAVATLGVDYPVVTDNDYRIWQAFDNLYWPAHYFIDGSGRIRAQHFGEGEYDQSERTIQALLREAGDATTPDGTVEPKPAGAQMAADGGAIQSPETYLGYARAERFVSPQPVVRDARQAYDAPPALDLNQWALAGTWTVADEHAIADTPSDRILFRFHARDLHLVLGPGPDGRPVRVRVRLDGAAPGADHGYDTDADGFATVTDQRLYQLVRQHAEIRDRTFEIEFLSPGAVAYAFTFG